MGFLIEYPSPLGVGLETGTAYVTQKRANQDAAQKLALDLAKQQHDEEVKQRDLQVKQRDLALRTAHEQFYQQSQLDAHRNSLLETIIKQKDIALKDLEAKSKRLGFSSAEVRLARDRIDLGLKRKYGAALDAAKVSREQLQGALTSVEIGEHQARLGKTHADLVAGEAGPPTPYDPIFSSTGQRYGMPPALLKAVADNESGAVGDATPGPRSSTSPAGARGLMQIMPENFKAYGITDPTDPGQNINAGAKMLSGLMAKHKGNLYMALVEYNEGGGNLAAHGVLPESDAYARNVIATYQHYSKMGTGGRLGEKINAGQAFSMLSARAQNVLTAMHKAGISPFDAQRIISQGNDPSLTPRDRELLPQVIASSAYAKTERAVAAPKKSTNWWSTVQRPLLDSGVPPATVAQFELFVKSGRLDLNGLKSTLVKAAADETYAQRYGMTAQIAHEALRSLTGSQ